MKNRRAQGFTLIELLIVIAIIGILAAVLIPQLLGARNTATARAAQAQGSNAYKALHAYMSSDITRNAASATAAGALGTDCLAAKSADGVGWKKAPAGVTSCAIATTADGLDFTVTSAGGGKSFTNGE